MQIEIVSFLLTMAITFVLAGYFLRQFNQAAFLFLTSSIIVLITGLLVASSGVEFVSAVVSTSLSDTILSEAQFSTPTSVNLLVSMTLILSGLAGLVTTTIYMNSLKKERYENGE